MAEKSIGLLKRDGGSIKHALKFLAQRALIKFIKSADNITRQNSSKLIMTHSYMT